VTNTRAAARLVVAWEYLDDPSVLDHWCRSHEVDNLFVVEGTLPTGTGINPTLTIMANAWRVADRFADASGTAG
jgi:choline dehydrogenase-like flavoprotein